MSFLSSLIFFVFWYCHSCALLCNSNKVLVIPEIFRWYYKHLSLDTFSHNCSCCMRTTTTITSHIYVRDPSIYRELPMFTYLNFKKFIQTTCACFESCKSMNMFVYLLVLCLSWEQLLKNYNLYQIHFKCFLNLKRICKTFFTHEMMVFV